MNTAKSVSVTEANRNFTSLLQQVMAGDTVTILSRRKPVAAISPIREIRSNRQRAKQRLLTRLRTQPASAVPVRDWTRQDLYETD